MDATYRPHARNAFPPQDQYEEELRRRIMWCLYFVDRQSTCFTGLPPTIEDRLFAVNYPMDDKAFQNGAIPGYSHVEAFDDKVKALARSGQSPYSYMRLIYKSMVLLGKISDHYRTHLEEKDDAGNDERDESFCNLESALTRLYLHLPSSNISEAAPDDLNHLVWLIMSLHTCSILLHHPVRADDVALAIDHDPPGYLRSWASVKTVIQMVNHAASLARDSLLNPWLGAPYFLCCRFLAIKWTETRHSSHQRDLDLFLMLIDKIGETWRGLGRKYRRSVEYDLSRSHEETLQLKVGCGNYMGPACYV